MDGDDAYKPVDCGKGGAALDEETFVGIGSANDYSAGKPMKATRVTMAFSARGRRCEFGT